MLVVFLHLVADFRGIWQSRFGSLTARLHLLPTLLALVAFLCDAENDCTGQQLARFPGGWPITLDVGLYWFDHNDVPSKAQRGKRNPFYDPMKRTVIFFHGWAGGGDGWTRGCHRVTTRCATSSCTNGNSPMFQAWLEAGWNVGFFYWDQFADEECARDAEQKIWFDRHGDGLWWKSYDPQSRAVAYFNYVDDAMSIADLCVQSFWDHLREHAGPEVRFVGHSIGAQLATRCAAMLHHQRHPAAPRRLALLEPYFTKHHLWLFRCVAGTGSGISTDAGVGDFAALATSDYARHLYDKEGVVTEVYKSSVYTEMSEFGLPNTGLEKFATYVEYEPRWCGGSRALGKIDLGHLQCRHDAAILIYFLGFAQPPPPLKRPHAAASESEPPAASASAACPTPAASCTYGHIKQWVLRQLHLPEQQQTWNQASGVETLSVVDDAYTLAPSLMEDTLAANRFVEAPVVDLDWPAVSSGTPGSLLHTGLWALLACAGLLAILGLVACWRFLGGSESLGSPGAASGADANEDWMR